LPFAPQEEDGLVLKQDAPDGPVNKLDVGYDIEILLFEAKIYRADSLAHLRLQLLPPAPAIRNE
jgi:hypothetical protein